MQLIGYMIRSFNSVYVKTGRTQTEYEVQGYLVADGLNVSVVSLEDMAGFVRNGQLLNVVQVRDKKLGVHYAVKGVVESLMVGYSVVTGQADNVMVVLAKFKDKSSESYAVYFRGKVARVSKDELVSYSKSGRVQLQNVFVRGTSIVVKNGCTVDEISPKKDIEFRIENGVLKGFDGDIPDKLVIPDGVKAIADKVFSGTGVKFVILPATLTEVGGRAFANCRSLVTVGWLKDGVSRSVEIGLYAFDGCTALKEFCGDGADFSVFSGKVRVKDGAFRGCTSLERVNITFNSSLGAGVFEGCTGVKKAYGKMGMVVPSKCFKGCTSLLEVHGFSNKVKKSAFEGCSSLVLYDVGCSDGEHFSGMWLTYDNILIQDNAFKGCIKLNEITLDCAFDNYRSAKSTGKLVFNFFGASNAFDETVDLKVNLTKFTTAMTILRYDSFSLYGKRLINLVHRLIGCFYNCGAKTARIEVGLNTYIVSKDMDCVSDTQGCFWVSKDLVLSEALKRKGMNAFYLGSGTSVEGGIGNCRYEVVSPVAVGDELVITDGTLEIPQRMYMNNERLEIVVLSNSVISIGEHAFDGCSNLRSVTKHSYNVAVGSELSEIGENAFANCVALKNIGGIDRRRLMLNTYDDIERVFRGCPKILETDGSVLIVSSMLTKIADEGYMNDARIKRVVLHKGIREIGANAFKGCRNLRIVEFENGDDSGLSVIGDGAFEDCTSLVQLGSKKDLVVFKIAEGSGVNLHLGNCAFKGCSSLRRVWIYDNGSRTSFGDYTFADCVSLIEFRQMGDVWFERVGIHGIFKGCSALRKVISGVCDYGSKYMIDIFEGCSQLSVIVGKSKGGEVKDNVAKVSATANLRGFADCVSINDYRLVLDGSNYDGGVMDFNFDGVLRGREGVEVYLVASGVSVDSTTIFNFLSAWHNSGAKYVILHVDGAVYMVSHDNTVLKSGTSLLVNVPLGVLDVGIKQKCKVKGIPIVSTVNLRHPMEEEAERGISEEDFNNLATADIFGF